jgi:SAM-dependent methyltransferase
MKYYDASNDRLIYISKKSTPSFWDSVWEVDENIRDHIFFLRNTFVGRITKRYLVPGEHSILEGGCGTGRYVAALANLGFTTVGLDYAYQTVKMLNKIVPELTIILGDVRNLPFRDHHFSGYWSLGVIEHFADGFSDIIVEMYRVLTPNGFLFLTFPYMSPLRRVKALLGMYHQWPGISTHNFHQFALNTHYVVQQFSNGGFQFLKSIPHDALTGAKDEIPLFNYLLKQFSRLPKNKFAGYFETIFNILFSRIASHCTLLIFKKIP